MDYSEFFQELTGKEPYAYQRRIAEAILGGRSIILRAPTGAGKTWAVVGPFLYSAACVERIGDRLLYALPLRTLVTNIHHDTVIRLKTSNVMGRPISTTSKDVAYPRQVFCCTVQMGGEAHDPFLEGDLVFTTIDQLLSSYLFHPISLPRRLDNINAGALIGAFVVLDEVHLLDSKTALKTAVEMLNRLEGLSQFALMTATLSDAAISKLCQITGAEYFEFPAREVQQLPTQKNKHRSYAWRKEELTATSVLADYSGGRTIVLLNTVKRAQQLFKEFRRLSDDGGQPQAELLLLHSRFFAFDRKEKERRVLDLFGPDANPTDAILVTTQVIEAGIDISAEQIHTELAPMNALVQRAGRTARYVEPRNEGKVTVYELTPDPNGKRRLGPYRGDEDLVDGTRSVLEDSATQAIEVDFSCELNWIERVHAEAEAGVLAQFESLHDGHPLREEIHRAMDADNRSCLSNLVRDANSINVLIADEPESLNFTGWDPTRRCRIGWPKLLSVPPGVLIGDLHDRFSQRAPDDWVVKAALPNDDEARDVRFQWAPLSSVNDIAAQWLIAIHPAHARYDSEIGLQLAEGGEPPDLTPDDLPPLPRYQYKLESWVHHAKRIVLQAKAMQPSYTVALKRLAAKAHVEPFVIQTLVEFVCALHDVGKLSRDWQDAAWGWQRDREQRLGVLSSKFEPIAHTDFDPGQDQVFYNRPEYRLPHHAVEGAFAVASPVGEFVATVISADIEPLWLAMIWAVGRHHAPRTKKPSTFQLVTNADEVIRAVLPVAIESFRVAQPSTSSLRELEQRVLYFTNPNAAMAWPFYAHFVRRLRLADQQATANAQGPDLV